jgi:hypothetical protein
MAVSFIGEGNRSTRRKPLTCCGHDCLVVGFTTTYAISSYRHYRCEFEPRSGKVYSIQHYMIKFVRLVASNLLSLHKSPYFSCIFCHSTVFVLAYSNIVQSERYQLERKGWGFLCSLCVMFYVK